MANGIFRAPTPTNEPVKAYAPGSPERLAVKAELQRQKATPIDIPLVIGGQRLTTGKTQAITAPHDKNLILAHCHLGTAEHAASAAKAAVGARREWAAMSWPDRASVFLKAADLLATKYRPAMNAATMLGQSKTVYQAEIDAACELIDFFRFNVHFMERIYDDQPLSPAGQWNRQVARALEGFVYAVTPFNFTSIAVNLPSAPALMGCGVVWKPALTSVLSSYMGYLVLEEAGLPPGVINFLPGEPGPLTDSLLANPDFAGLHFTGSTATFNLLWQAVGKNLASYKTYPRLVGETGGKDFIFAHPSADVDSLVYSLVRGAFEFQGQKCSAVSRAYLPKSLWPKVKDKLVALTNEIKMGDPGDFSNFMAAVIDERSFNKIKSYIDHARAASDAKIIAGGEYDDKVGYFVRPTVIETTTPRYRAMVEEIFGPILCIYPYDDAKLDETVRLCDESTHYGLTGAVFAKDRRAIASLTQAFENTAGNFYINDKPTGAVVGQQPFGGARNSGTNDKAGSMYNLVRWVSFRTIKENFLPVTDYKYPFMQES